MTIQKNIQNSPRKLRLVAEMIRKMTPEQALDTLKFTQNAAATPLSKAIKTALGNALKKEGLSFKKIEINEGPKLKRFHAGTAGRGRGRPYRKRWSHIKVVLTDEGGVSQIVEKRAKSEAKTEEAYRVEEELPKEENVVIEGEEVVGKDTKDKKVKKKGGNS